MSADTFITIILAFNIFLLIIYFIARIHRRSVDQARDDLSKIAAETKGKNNTEDQES